MAHPQRFLLVIVAPLLGWAQTPNTLDFENLSDGALVTSQFPGLTFMNAIVLTSGFSLNDLDFPARSGTKVISDTGGPISIAFATPPSSFSGYFTHQGAITLTAFGPLGNILSTLTSSFSNTALTADPAHPPNELIELSFPQAVSKLTVSSATAGSLTLDDVTINAAIGPAPEFGVSADRLLFQYTLGKPAPPPQNVSVSGSPPVVFTVASSAAWLRASSSSSRTPATVSVSVDGSALAPGHYNATLTFQAPQRSDQTIAVALTVLDRPQIFSVPTSLSFTWRLSDPVPPSKNIHIGAHNSNFNFTVAAKQDWITVKPQAGETDLEAASNITVALNPAALQAGTYQGSVVVTASDATNSPYGIPVNLSILAPLPVIQSVVNGGGLQPGPVAPGSMVAILGNHLASSQTTALGPPLPLKLGGVSVSVNRVAAPLFDVNPSRVTVQIPYTTPTGKAGLVVNTDGQDSAAFGFPVAAAAPGIILTGNRATATNQDGSSNTAKNPAPVGSAVTVFMTGLGAVDPPVDTGAAAPGSPLSQALLPISATIASQPARVLSASLTPAAVGMAQVTLEIPDLSSGDYPVVITVAGNNSNAAQIAVSGQ
jgi:uncharacterized protein (TIGR03437 family)